MSEWKVAWQYTMIPYEEELGKLCDITQKLFIRNNLKGNHIRIKFANFYNSEFMVLEQVSLAKRERGSGNITKIEKVTYQGKERIVIPSGKSFYSDTIKLSVNPEDDFVISIYFKEETVVRSMCCNWSKRTWSSSFMDGNQTMNMTVSGKDTMQVLRALDFDENKCTAEAGIWAVAVDTEEKVKTVAVFGDSITHMSYYYDPLAEELYQKYPGKITVMNSGIGGNRLIYDAPYAADIIGKGKLFGNAGVKRFEEDVYANTKADIVVLLEGINDCVHGMAFQRPQEIPGGEMLWRGAKKIIRMAHEKGSLIYLSTIMPFGCFEEPFRERAEAIRQDYNAWIREHKEEADGFLDLDEIMRKEEDCHVLKDGTHIGDGIHPNEIGGAIIANAMVEKWFL